MYDDSSGSTTFRPGEEDRRLAEAVPVMASRASTRFLRRFTSAPAGDQQAFIDLFINDSYPGESSKVAKHLMQAPQALIGPNL